MFHTALIFSLLCGSIGVVPPLTVDQQQRLALVVDGADERDDGFAALLENVQKWTPGLGDRAIWMNPDLDAMLARPQLYRGELCRIAGKIQQQTLLKPPHENVWEWFVRGGDARPILVYVAELDPKAKFEDGRDIEIDARFYKLVDALARDGKSHQYASFVGAFPRVKPVLVGPPVGENGLSQLWKIAAPVAAMSVAFAVLLVFIRRRISSSRRESALHWRHAINSESIGDERGVDGGAPLPDDPAAALAELQRRARSSPPSS